MPLPTPKSAVLLLCLGLSACAATEPGAASGSDSTRASAPRARRATAAAPAASGLRLAPQAEGVGTVQLFAGSSEAALPFLSLGRGERLTLAFDLLEGQGRPLSVYYIHADRAWRPDLFASQYVRGFERDDLIRYEPSRATQIPYTHYRHTFPGENTTFTVSGNYLVRVTELGQPDAVLFERPFFVTEDGGIETGIENALGAGIGTAYQPVVRVPSAGLDPGGFGVAACFVQDGRFAFARCTERPYRTEPGAFTFLLPPGQAFRPDVGTFYVDLRDLRISNRFTRVQLTQGPPEVALSPDDAVFPEALAPSLQGQVLVNTGARTAGDASTAAEYVETTFAFVPPNEQPLRDAYLEGAFSGWRPRAHPMTWVPAARRYETTVLVKQGQHEYRYTSTDPRLARAQSAVLGRPDTRFAALVYFRDVSAQTDRLVAVRTFGTRP